MATLFELVSEELELLEMLTDPDAEEDVIRDTLEAVDGELEVKAEGYVKILKEMEIAYDAAKAEAKHFSDKAKTIENNMTRLKDTLKAALIATGHEKGLAAGNYTLKVVGNGGKLPVQYADDINVMDLPVEYLTFPDPVINGEAVREALDAGEVLEFAKYGERGKRIAIK